MYDEALLQQIRDYLRQNGATYTTAALRERLIRDGVPAGAVDQVLAESQGSPYLGPAPQMAPASRSPWSVKTFFGVLVASVVVNLAVGGGTCLLAAWANNGSPFILAALAIVAEVVAAVVYARKNTSVTVALVVALAMTPVVAFVLLLGACLVFFIVLGNS